MKHLNPRQGITTSGERVSSAGYPALSVKHLNPRQGITTGFPASDPAPRAYCVKHLNPRQGITTEYRFLRR